MAHGDDGIRIPMPGGNEPPWDDVTGSRAPTGGSRPTFQTSAAVTEFNTVVTKMKGFVSTFGDEVRKATDRVKALGQRSGGLPGGGGSYTQQHMTFGGAQGLVTGPGGVPMPANQGVVPPGQSNGNTNRFGGFRGRAGGFFGRMWDPDGPGGQPMDVAARVQVAQQVGQIAGQLGSGVNRYFATATGQASVLDWAATQRTQMYGRYTEGRRETYNRFQSTYGNVRGWTDLQDLAQGSMINNRLGGSQSMLQQLGRGAQLNPTMGLGGTAQAYQQMMQPGALNAMAPFGGGAIANGGRRRQFDEMLGQYAMTATGTQGFGRGRGQLNQRWARQAFQEGGQGRQNLRALGMSEDMIDMVMTYSTASAGAGRALDLDSDADVRAGGFKGSFLTNVQQRGQRKGERDVRVFEDSRDAQENWNDLMGRGAQELGKFVDALGAANALFGAGKVGGAIGALGQTGLLGLGLNALLGRGGGGTLGGAGGPGMLGSLAARAGGGGLGGLAAGAGVLGLGGMAGYAVGSVADAAIPNNSKWQRGLGGAAKWGATGAGIGAAAGLLGGPLAPLTSTAGALIGGGIGALAGGIKGFIGDAVLPGPGRTAGLSSSFVERLKKMFAANPRLQLTSGFRSYQEQADLYAHRGSNPYPVAKPGTSRHESGVAADVGPRDQLAWVAQNASKFGLAVPLGSKDPVHVELAGAKPLVQDNAAAADEPITGGVAGLYAALAAASGGLEGTGLGALGGRRYSTASRVNFSGGGSAGASMTAGGGAAGSGSGKADNTSIINVLRSVGFKGEGLRLAYAIAMAESGGRANATNKNNDSRHTTDRGLFQINSYWHREVSDADAYNLEANARAAYRISSQGTQWNQWSTYKSGAYKKHYDPGLGDAVVGSGGGGAISASMTRQVVVQALHLNVKIDQVSEAEARRLGELFLDFINEKANYEKLGSH